MKQFEQPIPARRELQRTHWLPLFRTRFSHVQSLGALGLLSSKPRGEFLSPAHFEESLMNAFVPIIQSKGGINLPTQVWQPSQSRLRKNDDANSDPEGVYYIKVKKINLHTPAFLSQGPSTLVSLAIPSEHLDEKELEEKMTEPDRGRPLLQITQ